MGDMDTDNFTFFHTGDFPIGTRFKTRGKHPRLCTVVDILKTYNSAGELVEVRYLTTHECLGQIVTDRVVRTTIAMGQPEFPNAQPDCGADCGACSRLTSTKP